MSGLGISDFLRHTSEQKGGGGKFLDWKNDGKVDVWLHCRAPIVPSWSHQFIFADSVEDKDTGKQKRILRWPRYVSPDPEVVHANQYFREDSGVLRVRPDLDPFLLLREWLRFADDLALDAPIFSWHDPKERRDIVWCRDELSGLVKRGQQNFGHSLDTRLDYYFVVLPVGGDSLMIARESKLLGQRIGEVIRQQQEALGEEEGDPMRTPYAFRWESLGKKAKSPMDTYKAFRLPKVEPDDAVLAIIDSEDYPDTSGYGQPGQDDLVKIRAAFEAAQQVDLPLDAIFSEDEKERAALTRPRGAARPATRQAARPVAQAGAQRPAAGRPGVRQGAAPAGAAAKPAASTAKPAGTSGRRRVDKPKPAPEPEVELIPCDDCGEPLDPKATVCPKCGATYANDDDAPETTPEAVEPESDQAPVTDDAPCWSCGAAVAAGVCTGCGIEQSDDIPFP